MLMFGHRNSRSSNPEIPKCGSHLSFFFSHFRSLYMLMFGPRTREVPLKSQNVGLTFPFFAFRKFVYVDVWTPELAKFRTPKSRNACLTFPFSHFGSLYMLLLGTCSHEVPDPETPKCGSHFPFTIREIVVF
jgi:hypothetical protein